MRIVIDLPDDLPRESALSILNDCVNHAAATSICTGRMAKTEQDAYLAVAYHLRKAIRAAEDSERNPTIDGLVANPATTPALTNHTTKETR